MLSVRVSSILASRELILPPTCVTKASCYMSLKYVLQSYTLLYSCQTHLLPASLCSSLQSLQLRLQLGHLHTKVILYITPFFNLATWPPDHLATWPPGL